MYNIFHKYMCTSFKVALTICSHHHYIYISYTIKGAYACYLPKQPPLYLGNEVKRFRRPDKVRVWLPQGISNKVIKDSH